MSARSGFAYGFAAYLLWGTFPFYFMLLAAVDPLELVPWRVLTALGFCLVALAVMRNWRPLGRILRSPRQLGWFAVSSILLYTNWQIFVTAVVTGHIIETALGYFINPLVTILIGVFVRRERLRVMQWVAVGIAGVGVLVLAVAYGGFPWIALGLAFSFGLYGAVRKQVSEDVDALTGLTVETIIATPIALVQLGIAAAVLGGSFAFSHGPAVTIPLLLSGLVTAVPLLLFGAANRRLPLSQLGFIQFLTPILSFFTGWLVFGEEMTLARWIGFAAVWVALAVLLWDMVAALGRARRGIRVEPPPSTGEIGIRP